MWFNSILTNQEKINSSLFWLVMGIGFFGTGIAIIAFLPQSLKTLKSKKTNGVSVLTFSFYTLANSLWFIWGILDLVFNSNQDLITILKDSIVIAANVPCALWAAIILAIKIHNIYYYGEDCKKWKGKKNQNDISQSNIYEIMKDRKD